MDKERIGKMLIILSEEEVRQIMMLAGAADEEAIYRFVREVVARKVEAALRRRCG